MFGVRDGRDEVMMKVDGMMTTMVTMVVWREGRRRKEEEW